MSIFGWSYPAGAANDPYAPYNQTDDGEHNGALVKALRDLSTKHWKWNRIDCCLTGKDADLEPHGQQGIEVLRDSLDDDLIQCRGHLLTCIPGTDVALDCDSDDEDDYQKKLDSYLSLAQQTVIDLCPGSAEWDGDSWICSGVVDFSVPWLEGDNCLDYVATANAIVAAAEVALAPIEAQCLALHAAIGKLCDALGNELPPTNQQPH